MNDKFGIYVVDPDEAIRDSLELLLDSTFVDVYGFEDTYEFLEHAEVEKNGCALVENELADITGLTLFRLMRERGISLPVLLMTSSTDDELARYALESGITAVVRKPLFSEELIELIESARGS